MLKLFGFTAASILTAEALIMLALESYGAGLSASMRILLDCTLLLICVFPTLYILVFKDMVEQISRRREAELELSAWNNKLEMQVKERTEGLQRANEDLLIEVQERAKAALALKTALNETRQGKQQLSAILNAVNDALVVLDHEWHVLEANRAAEIMFNINSYDLQGKSLKNFLLPWSRGPADLDNFFSREEEGRQTFLVPPGTGTEERWPVQMRFGAELEWNQKPANVVTFYYRSDLGKTLQSTPMS